MPEPLLSVSASALLAMLRRQGGYWTISQVVHHWQPTWSASEVDQLLSELRHAGYLVQRPSPASANTPSFCALAVPLETPPFPIGPKATTSTRHAGELHA